MLSLVQVTKSWAGPRNKLGYKMLAKQHQYRSSFTTLGTGQCEMGIITVGHRPLYAYTLCLPATNQMLEVGTVWKQA